MAANTMGSCLGAAAFVLVGYEVHPSFLAVLISLGYAAVAVRLPDQGRVMGMTLGYLGAISASLYGGFLIQRGRGSQLSEYFGREGVVRVLSGKDVFLNGLWHSSFSFGNNHVGSSNWRMAAVPLLIRDDRPADVLIIGFSVGISAATYAQSDLVRRVDGYEINPEMRNVLRDYPDGSLHVLDHPKVHVRWEDARICLVTTPTTYDIIAQAPLHLAQAGSSALYSEEYFRIVKGRLRPGGIFVLYSNSQIPEQGRIARETARRVFRHGMSFGQGYLLIMTDQEVTWSESRARELLTSGIHGSAFTRDVNTFGVENLSRWLDSPPLPWDGAIARSTDDRPILEYPFWIRWIGDHRD